MCFVQIFPFFIFTYFLPSHSIILSVGVKWRLVFLDLTLHQTVKERKYFSKVSNQSMLTGMIGGCQVKNANYFTSLLRNWGWETQWPSC